VIDQRDQQMVVHLQVVHLQVVHLLHPRVHSLAKNVRPVVDVPIALVQRDKFPRGVKSVIHAGFAQLHKSAINLAFVRASLNQIFLMMSPVKNSKRVFVLNS
jgi:hypothetical protein